MLDGPMIRVLNAWCGGRGLSWSAAHRTGAGAAILLRPAGFGRPWRRMMLVWDAGELRLEDEYGDTLASASNLPALLDAMDGGVADAPPLSTGALASLMALPAGGQARFVV